jgi:hypothetical protein
MPQRSLSVGSDRLETPLSRRALLAAGGGAGLAALLAACGVGGSGSGAST